MNIKQSHHKIMNAVKISFAALMSLMITFSYLPFTTYSANHQPGKTYYVATNGSDSNPGSIDQPWRTIQYAADNLKAGETVLVRGGKYEEGLMIRSSGSANAGYITFQAYPGEQPILDASNLPEVNKLVRLNGANYIVFEGFELTGLRTKDPSTHLVGIEVSKGGSNIHILNNVIHHIEHVGKKGNANGILIYGNARTTNIGIEGNVLHDFILGSSESLTLVGNVDTFIVNNNTIYNVNNIGIDIAGHYDTCTKPCTDQARNGIVSNNTVFNVDTYTNPSYSGGGVRAAAGIYVDGGKDVIIEGNHVYQSNFGIEIASEEYGKVTSGVIARNNYIHNNHSSGILLGGSGDGTSTGGATNNIIINNTLYRNNSTNSGAGEITFQNKVIDNIIVNNLIYTSVDTPLIHDRKATSKNNIIDYNLYYIDGPVTRNWKYNNVAYRAWEDFKKGTGFDKHSIFADPMFTDIASGDITLKSNSPAINAGTTKYPDMGDLDYNTSVRIQGSNIDLGAIEYTGNENVPQPEPSIKPSPSIVPSPSVEPSPSIKPSPSVKPSPNPDKEKSEIIIDGLDMDWAHIQDQVIGSANVKSMKSTMADNTLYVLIKGKLLNEKGQLYISTESGKYRSFKVPHWSNSKATHMVENGNLYRYTGDGESWKWEKIVEYSNSNSVIRSTVVELAIPLNLLGVSDQEQLSIGYIWKDSLSNKLPLDNTMKIVDNDKGITPAPVPTPVPIQKNITIDGKVNDWLSYPELETGSNNIKSIKITDDLKNLYILIQGSKLNGKFQIYFNTDLDSKKGYMTSKWSSTGIDYLLENGSVYQYTGSGKDWAFKNVQNLKKSNMYFSSAETIELSIPLELIKASNEIKLGFLLDDKNTQKLPVKGDMISYTLK